MDETELRMVLDRAGSPYSDPVAVEAPLEIRVEDRSIGVLMRTPGNDLELAAGFLHTEGIIEDRSDLSALDHLPGDPDRNTVIARLAAGVEAHLEAIERATRERFASSSCGVCGKASIDRILLSSPPCVGFDPDERMLTGLPAALEAAQDAFRATGGVHGAALVSPSGNFDVLREDIGRHNAVDKVIGWRLLQAAHQAEPRLLLVSSRAGFEIVQKASMAGIGCVVSIGAASSLAIDLAAERGMTLIGFLRADRHTRYV
jgi:FdhD protein